MIAAVVPRDTATCFPTDIRVEPGKSLKLRAVTP